MKICPSSEELESDTLSVVACQQPSCGKSFKTSSNLTWHLKKHHNVDASVGAKYPRDGQFHCPNSCCIYKSTSERYFSTFKNLKQHYLKVHAPKKYDCPCCEKAFSRRSDLGRHRPICGTIFTCSCGYAYSSHEALLTHVRRYDHELPEEFRAKRIKLKSGEKRATAPVKSRSCVSAPKSSESMRIVRVGQPACILPKPAPISSLPLTTVAAIALSELSVCHAIPLITGKETKGTQTCGLDFCPSPKPTKHASKISKLHRVKRNRNSAQTQTTTTKVVPANRIGVSKLPSKNLVTRENIDTQTTVSSLDTSKCNVANAESPTKGQKSSSRRKRKVDCESIETQTNTSFVKSKSRTPQKHKKVSLQIRRSVSPPAKMVPVPIWECLDKDENEPLHVSTDVMLSDFGLPTSSSATQTSPRVTDSETNTDLSSEILQSLCDGTATGSDVDNLVGLGDLLDSSTSFHANNAVHTQTDLNIEGMLPLDRYLIGDQRTEAMFLNSETQTTDDFLENIDYSELLTNMETQTGDDLFPLELTFSTTHTQTPWDDSIIKSMSNSGYVASTQTQTG